jgi:hypothetical protein
LCPPVSDLVETARWSTVIAHRWTDDEHINVLEVRAVLAGVRWALSQPGVVAAGRLLVLSDSSAAVGSLRKGRTSSYEMLRPLRSLHALLLASGLALRVLWVPSAINPADGASRQ